jgi:HPr kinase/phosphorylase
MSVIHGTCVSIGQSGVLIRGVSGAGKSDLALRLIDRGAALVADDCCEVEKNDGVLFLHAPAPIAGQMEVRGAGILRMTHVERARLDLIVDLTEASQIERLPEKTSEDIEGIQIAWMQVDPREASADAKVRVVVRALAGEVIIDAGKGVSHG